MNITEEQFAQAVNSRSSKPIYERLKAAHIGIAGLGGLGSNIAAAVVRSGVGHLTIVDYDTVELSNINRQLYSLKHIGKSKTEALTDILMCMSAVRIMSQFFRKPTTATNMKRCISRGTRGYSPIVLMRRSARYAAE